MLGSIPSLEPKISIFIQARMGSTRLPGKVLSLIGQKPIVQHLIDRLHAVKRAHQIALLIPTGAKDDPLAHYISYRSHIDLFRGAEEDVLSRFYLAAASFQSDIIVRITADCPFIDPKVVDAAIDLFLQTPYCSYVSNKGFPRGLDVEVFSTAALKVAFSQATDPAEREHVTLYLYRHPEKFTLSSLVLSPDRSALRVTVDEPDDLLVAQALYKQLKSKPLFGTKEILDLAQKKPELFLPNAHVKQKTVFLSDEVLKALTNIPKKTYLLEECRI